MPARAAGQGTAGPDSLLARVYLASVIGLGAYSLWSSFNGRFTEDPAQFVAYLAIAVLASLLKVRLPGIPGNLSVNFCFFLVAILELTKPEVQVIGIVSAVAQSIWRARNRVAAVRMLFNAGLISIALSVSYEVFHRPLFDDPTLGFPVRLMATAACYFVTNTAPVVVAIRLTEGKPMWTIWRDTYFWVFPYYLVGAVFAGLYHAAGRAYGWKSAILAWPVVYAVYRSFLFYLLNLEAEKVRAEMQRGHAEEVSNLHLRTIQALALAIEAKDHTTHDHLQRVQVYSMELAESLGVPEEEIQALRAAALLHDIGKLAVPEHIISKPGKLTPEEFGKMKIHPVVGAEILEHVQFPYPVVPIVKHHHEKWDGTGYPDGLRGEEIPIGARILSAVDCLDALASDRQYRRALPLDQAMQELERLAGTAYDPRVVAALRANYREWEKKARAPGNGRKLPTAVRVGGGVPAAGYEAGGEGEESNQKEKGVDFLSTIGAARHEAQTLHEMTQDMIRYLALDEMLSVVAVRLKKLIPYDAFAVYLNQNGVLTPEFVVGDDFRFFSSLRIPMGKGLSGWVAENRTPILNGNPSVEPDYENDPRRFSVLRSALAVPLESGTGVLGTLALYHAGRDAYNQDHLRILLLTAGKLAQSVQNSLQYRVANDTSMTDYLTGLPNARSLFTKIQSELRQCEQQGESLAVLVCDLDGFKGVNDRFGHLTGNEVLRGVAKVLQEQCRPHDYAARMGGDEFVLIMRGLDPASCAIIQRISEAVEGVGREICGESLLSVSIGYAVAPEDGREPETLIAAADQKMYRRKEGSRQDRLRRELLSAATAVEGRPVRV